MQDLILDKITRVQAFIELHSHRQTETISAIPSSTIISDNLHGKVSLAVKK